MDTKTQTVKHNAYFSEMIQNMYTFINKTVKDQWIA